MKKHKLFFISTFNIFLFILLLASIANLYIEKTRDSYLFARFILILFIIVFTVTVLDYQIFGHFFGIKKELAYLKNQQNEIYKVTNALLKITYIVADGSNYWEGVPEPFKRNINKYVNDISHYLEPNFKENISKELDDLKTEQQSIADKINKDKLEKPNNESDK